MVLYRVAFFLCLYTSINMGLICILRNLRGCDGPENAYICGFLCSSGILCEKPYRRTEMTIYTFSKNLEMLWKTLVNRGICKSIKFGEVFIFCLAMCYTMFCYEHAPQTLKASYFAIIRQIFGVN